MSNQNTPDTDQNNDFHSFAKKVLISGAAVTAIIIIVFVVGYSFKVLLLLFAGVLLGVILRSLRDYVKRFIGLPNGISLAVVIVFLGSIFGTTGYLLGPRMLEQANMLYREVPKQWTSIQQEIWQYEWGKEIVRENPKAKDVLENEEDGTGEDNDMTKSVVSLFSLTASAIASTFLVLVIAIYVAAEPGVYQRIHTTVFYKKKTACCRNNG